MDFALQGQASFGVGQNMFGPARGNHSQTLALVLTDSIPRQGHGQKSLLKRNHCKSKVVEKSDIKTHIESNLLHKMHSQTFDLVLTDSSPNY